MGSFLSFFLLGLFLVSAIPDNVNVSLHYFPSSLTLGTGSFDLGLAYNSDEVCIHCYALLYQNGSVVSSGENGTFMWFSRGSGVVEATIEFQSVWNITESDFNSTDTNSTDTNSTDTNSTALNYLLEIWGRVCGAEDPFDLYVSQAIQVGDVISYAQTPLGPIDNGDEGYSVLFIASSSTGSFICGVGISMLTMCAAGKAKKEKELPRRPRQPQGKLRLTMRTPGLGGESDRDRIGGFKAGGHHHSVPFRAERRSGPFEVKETPSYVVHEQGVELPTSPVSIVSSSSISSAEPPVHSKLEVTGELDLEPRLLDYNPREKASRTQPLQSQAYLSPPQPLLTEEGSPISPWQDTVSEQDTHASHDSHEIESHGSRESHEQTDQFWSHDLPTSRQYPSEDLPFDGDLSHGDVAEFLVSSHKRSRSGSRPQEMAKRQPRLDVSAKSESRLYSELKAKEHSSQPSSGVQGRGSFSDDDMFLPKLGSYSSSDPRSSLKDQRFASQASSSRPSTPEVRLLSQQMHLPEHPSHDHDMFQRRYSAPNLTTIPPNPEGASELLSQPFVCNLLQDIRTRLHQLHQISTYLLPKSQSQSVPSGFPPLSAPITSAIVLNTGTSTPLSSIHPTPGQSVLPSGSSAFTSPSSNSTLLPPVPSLPSTSAPSGLSFSIPSLLSLPATASTPTSSLSTGLPSPVSSAFQVSSGLNQLQQAIALTKQLSSSFPGAELGQVGSTLLTPPTLPVLVPSNFAAQAASKAVQLNQPPPNAKKKRQRKKSSIRHPCPTCKETFPTKFSLKRHSKRHTGEKPYVCDYKFNSNEVCGIRFAEKSTLKRHLQSHTGEKPFKCPAPDCEREFADRSNLGRHIRRAHKGLQLPEKVVEDLPPPIPDPIFILSASESSS